MRVLFLSSTLPCFGHAEAISTVFAVVLESFALQGIDVSWAIDGTGKSLEADTATRLEAIGVKMFADFSSDTVDLPTNRLRRRLAMLRGAFFSLERDDVPRFRDPAEIARRIEASGADLVLLFWDTSFEFLTPHLRIPVVAYTAKPRYEAAMVRLRHEMGGGSTLRLLRRLNSQRLAHQRRRHLDRVRRFAALSNIDAKDARAYNSEGVPCEYVPNTWGDPFGDDWRVRRRAIESETLNIFGSFSTLTSTGNQIGISYWTNKVVPLLSDMLTGPWVINVYGKGAERLPTSLRLRLNHPNIRLCGFVADIDREFLRNQIFLLCNNAGPYSGGYTRVIYAMAAGSCLVAHRNLADSMPEVVDGQNALLCDSPADFATAIQRLSVSPKLREQIATGARETYLYHYRPEVVGATLATICRRVS